MLLPYGQTFAGGDDIVVYVVADVRALVREIDRLVSKLYGVAKEEIAIVEGSTTDRKVAGTVVAAQ